MKDIFSYAGINEDDKNKQKNQNSKKSVFVRQSGKHSIS